MSPVTRIGGGISVASRGLVLGEGIRVPMIADSGPPPFVSDSFTDTAGTTLQTHTGEVGATWTRHASYSVDCLITASGRVRRGGTSGVSATTGYYTSAVPASAEYDVESDFIVMTAATIAGGVAGRVQTAANTMYVARYDSGNTRWQLISLVAGVVTDLGTFTQSLTLEQPYRVKLEIRDAAKKVYVDGAERISSATNAITATGRVGVRHSDTGGAELTGLQLDNFAARNV